MFRLLKKLRERQNYQYTWNEDTALNTLNIVSYATIGLEGSADDSDS
jgi:hypothetical protein